jgi:hypothetical protein
MNEPKLLTKDELADLAVQADAEHAMNSGCTDYACYCHYKLPTLLAHIAALEAREAELLRERDEARNELRRLRIQDVG